MTNWVTVKVPEADRDTAREHRPEGATYGDCLVAGAKALADAPDFTATAAIRPTLDADAADDLRAELERITEQGMKDALDFPTADVKEALRQVLREELPEGVLR